MSRESVHSVFKHELKPYERPSEYLERVRSALGYSNYSLVLNNDAMLMRERFFFFFIRNTNLIQISLQTMIENASIGKIVRVADSMHRMFCTPKGKKNHFPTEKRMGTSVLLTRRLNAWEAKSREQEGITDSHCIKELIKNYSEIMKQIKDLSRNVNFMVERTYSDPYGKENFKGIRRISKTWQIASAKRNSDTARKHTETLRRWISLLLSWILKPLMWVNQCAMTSLIKNNKN